MNKLFTPSESGYETGYYKENLQHVIDKLIELRKDVFNGTELATQQKIIIGQIKILSERLEDTLL